MGSLRARWRWTVEGLWFLPSTIVLLTGILAVGLDRVDRHVSLAGSPWVFGGNANAARTVFQTLATSLISVAGLTFSVTMVVLQLASSQFSPRVLPNFLGDRLTQATVGAFVGVFVYSMIGLRSVGAERFVPRVTVTVGAGFGVVCVILLIAFIHHISTMIQVSHIARRIGDRTLDSIDALYPRRLGERAEEDPEALLARETHEPAQVVPPRQGYVQEIDLAAIAERLDGRARLARVTATPGDFVSSETPVLEVWPAEAADGVEGGLRQAFVVTSERNFAQDAAFGVRQLADIALRAISPGINDPTTAVTCIGYVRSVLERLAARELPAEVRRFEGREVVVVARRVAYEEYLETLVEIGRYANGDARVVRQLLRACAGVAAAARRAGAEERAAAVEAVAEPIAEQAREQARTARDRELVDELLERVRAAGYAGSDAGSTSSKRLPKPGSLAR